MKPHEDRHAIGRLPVQGRVNTLFGIHGERYYHAWTQGGL